MRRARLELLAESARPARLRARGGALRGRARAARWSTPRALTQRAARSGPARARDARTRDEVAAIYRAYRDGLERRRPRRRRAVRLARPRRPARRPGRWGRTPVFVYGFDDFTPVELDALETLAERCDADVTVSLPYERGPAGVQGGARTVTQELLATGRRGARAARRSTITTRRSRAPRSTTSSACCSRTSRHGARRPAGARSRSIPPAASAPRWSWRPRGCSSCCATGVRPGDVAVVFRDPARYASLVEQVFGAYGIPYSIDRKLPLRPHRPRARPARADPRAAGPAGTADDLLAYLRTPGLLHVPGFADSLEAEVRRDGAHRAADARELLGARPLAARGARPARARARRPEAFVSRAREPPGAGCSPRPTSARATVLSGPRARGRRARCSAAQQALAELRAVLGRHAARTRPHVLRLLEQLEVRVGETPQPDRVQVATPEAIRARRFEAVFACGLQEGEFPRGASPEPFLSDDDRRAIAEASGLVLPVREDRLDRERYLFYVCASRAERLLVLQLAVERRGGQPAGASRSSSTTCATCSTTAPRSARARSPTSPGAPRRPRPRPSGTAPSPPRGPRRAVPRAGAAQRRAAPGRAGRPRRRLGRRARELRRLPGEVARRGPAAARSSSSRTPRRWCAAATRTPCSSATYARLREETG